ncbi:MAG: RHS repeat-associated core domain-containing protein, partial [Schleiferiaceae bacterium]
QHFYYAPFGDPMVSQHVGTGSFNSDFRFNAKEYDEETGNYYYGARYYEPKSSVWMGVDAMATSYPGMNPYNFVMGNPLTLIDPDGNDPIEGGRVNKIDFSKHFIISLRDKDKGMVANDEVLFERAQLNFAKEFFGLIPSYSYARNFKKAFEMLKPSGSLKDFAEILSEIIGYDPDSYDMAENWLFAAYSYKGYQYGEISDDGKTLIVKTVSDIDRPKIHRSPSHRVRPKGLYYNLQVTKSEVYSLSGHAKTLVSRTSYRIIENPEYSKDNDSVARWLYEKTHTTFDSNGLEKTKTITTYDYNYEPY